MNTYKKYCPNVFIAQCTEKHEKGEIIIVETKYGKENECIIFNLIAEKDGFYYYSIVRADGFNQQEWAKKKAERLQNAALNAEKKSDRYWKASNEGADFLALGEPIKVGHHSEKRHRALIERNHNRMSKAVEFSKQAEEYESRVAYWAAKANSINLSMPESLEFFEAQLEEAKEYHRFLKDNPSERPHGMALSYASKKIKELKSKHETAVKLWA
jgi:hypothetical protein